MTKEDGIDSDFVPRWARGVRTRYDEVRQRWMILGPERILVPQGPGVDIARLVDGERSIDEIVRSLAEEYDADMEVIEGESMSFLEQLLEQGYLES